MLLYHWRYYSFGREKYSECINNMFINNMDTLRRISKLVAIFVACCSLIPLLIEKLLLNNNIGYINTAVYLVASLLLFFISFYVNYRMQTGEVSSEFIYIFTTLYFVIVMSFGIYLGIWSVPDKLASVFMCFLICSLLMFINPPIYNFCLNVSAMLVFIAFSFIFKERYIAIYNTSITLIAGIMSLYFGWHISKLRIEFELSSNMLEEERNKYLDESTVDELTQLNNRRDFTTTFKRYLSCYRTSDDYLCVAISDIDFFKNYNDHYGHPQGDDCLRSVGAAFNKLKEEKGVYVARIGGEEFGMLWFEKDASHVDAIVTYMSELIHELKIPHEKSKISNHVTMSIGVYLERLGSSKDVDALYELADNALYAAKGSGRNCAIITGRDIEQYKITPQM